MLVLQHPLEVRQAKGSARLLSLSLTRCRLWVGESFEPSALTAALEALGPTPVLLYPDTSAVALGAPVAGDRRPSGLVVVDATWRKSLRMLHLNPLLQGLPRWALSSPPPSRYAIRAAPRTHQRSTLEATCLALAELDTQDASPAGDGPEGVAASARYAPLLDAFEAFVAALAARMPSAPGS